MLSRQQPLIAFITSSSEFFYKGSILSRIDPSKIEGSYIIIVMDDLNYYKLKVEISIPLMSIDPSIASSNLKRVIVIVDLPAPVLPTTPIFSKEFILIEILFKAGGSPSRYYTE